MATPRELDFNEKPYIVIWETTQACDLACVHCRACAQPQISPLASGVESSNGSRDGCPRGDQIRPRFNPSAQFAE